MRKGRQDGLMLDCTFPADRDHTVTRPWTVAKMQSPILSRSAGDV